MNCLRAFHSEGVVNKHTPGKFNLREFDHHRQLIRKTTFDGAADAQLTRTNDSERDVVLAKHLERGARQGTQRAHQPKNPTRVRP